VRISTVEGRGVIASGEVATVVLDRRRVATVRRRFQRESND
jgi:hypothetical protein